MAIRCRHTYCSCSCSQSPINNHTKRTKLVGLVCTGIWWASRASSPRASSPRPYTPRPCSLSHRSASSADMAPVPADVSLAVHLV